MKTLTTVSWMYQADSLCVQLASHGIEASIPDQGAMSALPLHGSALGGIRVQVDEEDFEKARDILRGISAVFAEQKPSCPKCGSLQVEYKRQSWFVAALVVILVGIPLLWLKKKFQCHSCGHRWEEDPVKEETTEAEQPAVQVQSEGAFRLAVSRGVRQRQNMKHMGYIIGFLVLTAWVLLNRKSPSIVWHVLPSDATPAECSALPNGGMSSKSLCWIFVGKGSPRGICDAITEYSQLSPAKKRTTCDVSVYQSPSGYHAVTFDPTPRAYHFCNLVGWLYAPPETSGVTDSVGWFTSPGTGMRYVLFPEPGNQYGDTLVGLTRDSAAVRVYQPECTLLETSRNVVSPDEPAIDLAALMPVESFTVTFDDEFEDFGNSEFLLTRQ
jgi:hypothetical protein